MLFDVVATLSGGATLGAGPSTLCDGTSILVAGWFVSILVNCCTTLTCFALSAADVGIILPNALSRSVAARMERSCCDAMGIWQCVG